MDILSNVAVREDTRSEDRQPISTGIETALPLDAPLLGFHTPVEIGQSLWGPFHRLHLQAEAAGQTHTVWSGPFDTEYVPNGSIRISTTLHVPTDAGTIRAGIAMLRSASGEMIHTELTAPPDASPSTTATLEALRGSLFRSAGGFLARRSFRMGELFESGAQSGGAVPMMCRVIGQSAYQGRPVLVAHCTNTQPLYEAGSTGLLFAEGQVAIDIETGVTILSALQCHVSSMNETAPALRVQAWFTLRQQAEDGE